MESIINAEPKVGHEVRGSSGVSLLANLKFLLAGVAFGVILIKGELVSWFRIQEMFRFQSFHMYGTLGSAILVGMISIWLIKKLRIKTLDGAPISIPNKKFNKGYIYG